MGYKPAYHQPRIVGFSLTYHAYHIHFPNSPGRAPLSPAGGYHNILCRNSHTSPLAYTAEWYVYLPAVWWFRAELLFQVILVGYETVNEHRRQFDADTDVWWAPRSLPTWLRFYTSSGECQPAELPLDTPLRTNSPLQLFAYSEHEPNRNV